METEKWKTIKLAFSEIYELPVSARSARLAELPADIRAEVENLLDADRQAEDFIAEPFLIVNGLVADDNEDKWIGRPVDSYLVLERLGTGGMGAVYLAQRQNSDLKQKVALKLIKRGMDSDAILKRFAVERRILSSLDHPNIARLVDGSISSDGLPYFVMEFVDGNPLNKYLLENQLTLEDRLGVFRQICSAVEHAHKNLVVHRDLKPSNILVTADGTPKLLDFGIAKLLSDDDGAATNTATRGRVFTPEYASPEQILGKTVTTAADIYSLGVLLFELLTRHRPYDVKGKSYEEIVRSICETAPPKPSDTGQNNYLTEYREQEVPQIQRNRLRGDLDNIVLKSLRKDPSERYGSVRQLDDDISRFLNGLPVLARPQTVMYRFGKYVKRHKVGVFAAAVVLVSLIAGAMIATWQAVVAKRERAKAEKRFNDVRKLANSFLFEFHDAIRDLPGATPARKLVIDRALPFLDDLARESNDDDSLQNELAESYRKLGEIQGHPSFPNIGDVSGGIESFGTAIRLGSELVARNPDDRNYRLNLANYYVMLGDMYGVASYDTPKAFENYQTARQLLEELQTEGSGDLGVLKTLAVTYDRVGNIKAKTGETDAAISYFRDSLAISEQLQAFEPTNNKRQRNIYLDYYSIGRALQADGKYRDAIEQYSKGRAMAANSLAAEPNSADIRRNIAIIDDLAANAHLQLGEVVLATTLSNNAIAVREKLFAADPTNIQVYGDLTVSLDTAGDLGVKAGDIAGALKLLNRSLEMREAALKQDPTMTLAKRYVAISLNKIAAAYRAKNDLSAALAQLDRAVTLNRELSRDDPTNMELLRELAASLKGTGETMALIAARERNPNKLSEARNLLEESLKVYTDMKANNQFYGADSEKVKGLNTIIKEHTQEFSR